MTEAYVMTLAQDAMTISLLLAGPVLIVSLIIGIVVSLVQAATQINEATLTFVPKLIGVVIILALLGSWMLQQAVVYTSNIITNLPNLVK